MSAASAMSTMRSAAPRSCAFRRRGVVSCHACIRTVLAPETGSCPITPREADGVIALDVEGNGRPVGLARHEDGPRRHHHRRESGIRPQAQRDSARRPASSAAAGRAGFAGRGAPARAGIRTCSSST